MAKRGGKKRGALQFFCSLKGALKTFCDKYFLHQAPLTSVCERSLKGGSKRLGYVGRGSKISGVLGGLKSFDILKIFQSPTKVFMNGPIATPYNSVVRGDRMIMLKNGCQGSFSENLTTGNLSVIKSGNA